MRRKILVLTALLTLVGASAAFAAVNNYSGSKLTFSKGVGSKAKPVGVGFKEILNAANTDPSKAAAVLVDIKVKIYGLVSNAKHFPTCSAAKMSALKSDSFCPKKSKFATGSVNSLLGDPSLAKSSRIPCNPGLDVFHAGGNKLWFFFTASNPNQCAGLHTGDTAAYPGTIKQQGKYQLTDVPLPPDVSTKVANHQNLYGSLIHQTLTWAKLTTKVKGKTVASNESIGCLKGKRPYSITFTSTTNGSNRQVETVKGSFKC